MDTIDTTTTFTGMYLSNEIHLGGIVRFVKRIAAAIDSHLVSMPSSTALHEFNAQIA